jgi:hypothetical protein
MNHHTSPFKRSLSVLALIASCGGMALTAVAGETAPTTTTAAAAPANKVESERWYVLQLDGAKAGSLRDSVSTTPEGNRATTQEIVFNLSRAGTKIEVTMKTGFVETAQGKPVSMSLDQNLGLMHIQTDFEFTDDGVLEKTRQGDVVRSIKHPKIEGDWLTPSAIDKLVQAKLKGGEKSFAYRTVSPTSGAKAFDTKVKVIETGTAEAMGKLVPATKWETEASVMPGTTNTEWVTAEGRPVRSEVEIAGMKLLMLLSDKEVATSAFTAPEAMAQTSVVPTGVFKVPARAAKDAIYTVGRGDNLPMTGWPLGGLQRATDQRNGDYLVKVDLSWPVPMFALKDPETYLASTTACNAEDPEIVAFANKAIEGMGDNNFERAKRIRIAVNKHIQKKSLDVGFGTASEVIRTKQGDCTEHAVLLAAALRAVKIPSRVISGVIYCEEFEGMRNVFVYHMWTQAFVQRGTENNWIDLDATLPGEGYFDAGHIGLTASNLSDDETLNTMVGLSEIIGKLRINVELVE